MAKAVYAERTWFSKVGEQKECVVKERASLRPNLLYDVEKRMAKRYAWYKNSVLKSLCATEINKFCILSK